MDISVLDVPDFKFNPLGALGVGKIGITGAAAAVANAVFLLRFRAEIKGSRSKVS
jgi:xanthine dehydrogenase YagR molybdenum-binding subunit